MRRYQARAKQKTWVEAGPDLLRKLEGAVGAVADLLPRRADFVGRVTRGENEGEWQPLGKRRRNVEEWLREALPTLPPGNGLVAVGVRKWATNDIRAVVRSREVRVEALAGATTAAEVTNALLAEAPVESIFAGAFVCKQIDGSTSYSDHAWGDAVDRTTHTPGDNDALTSWAARMAKARELPVSQILGSQGGHVVEARRRVFGNWALNGSSASSSHLWHVHVSCREHDGIPPCAS
jgi:hypothetical protein